MGGARRSTLSQGAPLFAGFAARRRQLCLDWCGSFGSLSVAADTAGVLAAFKGLHVRIGCRRELGTARAACDSRHSRQHQFE